MDESGGGGAEDAIDVGGVEELIWLGVATLDVSELVRAADELAAAVALRVRVHRRPLTVVMVSDGVAIVFYGFHCIPRICSVCIERQKERNTACGKLWWLQTLRSNVS